MASRTATTSRSLYEEPFWRTPVAKITLTVILLVAAIFGIQKLERINNRHQVEARLARHPTLGPLLEKWRGAVSENQKAKQRPNDQLPMALYFGKVAEFVETRPAFGLAPTRLLKLASPELLGGAAAKLDSRDQVAISFKNHPNDAIKPKAGEDWLIVVWRDSEGKNVLHTAFRCDAP